MKQTLARPPSSRGASTSALIERWFDLVEDAVESWPRWSDWPDWPWAGRRWTAASSQDGDCQARPCPPPSRCDDHCHCCISDADVVVEVRVGEVRVLPIAVENATRRESKVRVEIGEFQGARGDETARVEAKVEPEGGLEVGPCGQREVTVRLGVAVDREQQRGADVSNCEVLYGDLRLVGCDRRPLRIAVAVVPRDCNLVTVDCRTGCC